MKYPILDFDKDSKEILRAVDHTIPMEGFPEVVIFIFSYKILAKWKSKEDVKEIAVIGSASGVDPIYQMSINGVKIAFKLAHVGAPLCVGTAEELIALGAKKFVYFGSCGVLDASIKENTLIIPSKAIRDEGTSYHYQEPSVFNEMNKESVKVMKNVFEKHCIDYIETTTWTTDAFYRETVNIMNKRKKQGARVVDMEVASLIAMTQFRGIKYAHFLYGADNLDAEVWEKRNISDQGFTYADLYMKLAIEIGVSL